MCDMINVLGCCCLMVEKTEVGQDCGKDDEETNYSGNAGMLKFTDVALVELFQFIVFESVGIHHTRQNPWGGHGFDAVIHGDCWLSLHQ